MASWKSRTIITLSLKIKQKRGPKFYKGKIVRGAFPSTAPSRADVIDESFGLEKCYYRSSTHSCFARSKESCLQNVRLISVTRLMFDNFEWSAFAASRSCSIEYRLAVNKVLLSSFHFRIPKIIVRSWEGSPIKHVRLQRSSGDQETDCEILNRITNAVSAVHSLELCDIALSCRYSKTVAVYY